MLASINSIINSAVPYNTLATATGVVSLSKDIQWMVSIRNQRS